MRRDTRMLQLALAITVVCASAFGWAQSREARVWIPLDPSKAEHAAILRWHRALLANDYAAYLRYRGPTPGLSEASQRTYFANVRAMTPPMLMITANPTHVNPNGSKDYAVAGCMKLPGETNEMRMVAGVTPYQKDGQWRIGGSDFGPPSNNTIRACPVK